jgi:transposase
MKKQETKKRGNQESQESTRIRVVEYLKKKLGTQKEASVIFGIEERSINRIWAKYKSKGKRVLQNKKRGVREGKKLNALQATEIKKAIKNKLPDQLKLPFGLWTRDAVKQLLIDKYAVTLSRWQIGRYLKSWGYTPQKPISKAFEQKPEKVKQWLKKEFPAIKKRAKRENAVIYFGDETGMRSDHQSGRSYAPKGETPVIKRTGQRFSLNMISAISNKGYLQFMILDGRFNSAVFETFLAQMIKYSRQKIFFITDGHPAHKTKTLNVWLEENKNRIEVFFLPPYSPELNPQEYVNQDVKTNIIGKKRPINKEQMRNNVENFMTNRKKNKTQVQKYFHEKHVLYAA